MRLSASNIALERGGRRLFAGLSLEIAAGEALIVTGPNGAGKSSLLRAIAGFLRLREGSSRSKAAIPSRAWANRRITSAMPTR